MSLFLSNEELKALTGKQRKSAQVSALETLGISHKVRPDGAPLVLRAHIEMIMGGTDATTAKAKKKPTPNWSALDVPA